MSEAPPRRRWGSGWPWRRGWCRRRGPDGAGAAAARGAPPASDPRQDDEAEAGGEPEGFVLPATTQVTPPLVFMGYVDVGFADAEGNGTSYPAVDTRLPADYGVDTFAPAVNSRGDVASHRRRRAVRQRLPAPLGGHRRAAVVPAQHRQLRPALPGARARRSWRSPALQLLPRFGAGRGNQTLVLLEQAFGRVTPIPARSSSSAPASSTRCSASSTWTTRPTSAPGSPLRCWPATPPAPRWGSRPSSASRSRPLWSAVSLNTVGHQQRQLRRGAAAARRQPDRRAGAVARLGYELNLPLVQVKLGGSGLTGPAQRPAGSRCPSSGCGASTRASTWPACRWPANTWTSTRSWGRAGKETGLGAFPVSSEFQARGFWAQAAYAWQAGLGPLTARHRCTAATSGGGRSSRGSGPSRWPG